MRQGIAVAVALLLGGCVSFLPTYDAAIHARLDGALTDLERIRAALGVPYQPAPGFKDVEPLYISALGGVIAAERIATGRVDPRAVRRGPDARAAELVAGAIGTCRAAIEAMMRRHQSGGRVDGEIFDNSRILDTCGIPQVMESRLQR